MFRNAALLPPSIAARQKALVQSMFSVIAAALLVSIAVAPENPQGFLYLRLAYAVICIVLAIAVPVLGIALSAGLGLAAAFAYVTAVLTIAGTVRTPVAAGYVLLVILGGIFFGRTGWIVCMLLSSAATAALTFAETSNLLPQGLSTPRPGQWISYTTLFILSGLAVQWSLAVQNDALQKAAFELNERKLAEKALLEREARLRALHEYSPFPAFIWQKKDNDFELTGYNRAADELTDRKAESMLGMHASHLYRDQPEIVQAMQEALEKGVTRQGELKYTVRSTGQDLIVSAVYGFVPPDSIQVIIEDITARKNVERELKRAREEAERSSRAKSEFLSAMSHELRTPLNVILGFAQQLERSDDLAHRAPVERILDAGWYLSTLLNDLLDMSRLETGTSSVQIAPVDLSLVVRETLQLLTPQAARKNLKVSTDVPPDSWILADANRIRQVLINLAANAIKYNNPGGFVGIAARREGESMRLDITDSGRGISPDMVDRIFEPFVREERAGTVEGSGIGLWVARELVEQMKGTVTAESAPGRGSVFTVTLPVGEKPCEAPAVTVSELKLSGRILIVDDNELNLTIAASACRYWGAEVDTASCAEEALRMLESASYTAVLLDVQMPEIDGLECARRIRAQYGPDLFVAAISADASKETEEQALSAGMDAFLAKPFRHADLAQLLQSRRR